MINQTNIETLFDYFDASSTLLYKTYKKPYLDGLVISVENLMSNTVEEIYQEIKSDLVGMIRSVSEIDFQPEEIRKAFQFACLKGFKHANQSNQMITPETIGIFIQYLISKLYDKKNLRLLDPLVGTGNLITTVANHMEEPELLVGVDMDQESYRLSSALFDLLGYGDQVYYQDTNTFLYPVVDAIIMDASGIEKEQVYEIMKHHEKNLVEGGFLIGVFDGETVQPEILVEHSQGWNGVWKLFGMIHLPQTLTKQQKKSIVVLQRDGSEVIQPNRFLLVDLPDFSNQTEMKHVISQLNDWFTNTEFYKV